MKQKNRLSFKKSLQFFKKTNELIPLAAQTFSKSYLQFIKNQAPLFITHAKGSHTWDIDGNEYIDFINGLTAVTLGHQYPAINHAIKNQLKKGISLSLSSPLEHELALLLKKHIPCTEMVRFGKNGSDVTTGAIRLARAITKRDHIVVCGYHGWHDWYIGSTPRHLGVPASTRKLTHSFTYNDISSLEKLFLKYPKKIAAVIMEPVSYIEPKNKFLEKVKNITHKNNALLIFDEIVTGFKIHIGGAQKYYNVIPDLATFGKSIANGMPISALVGKKKYMKSIKDIFYSFTFGGECLSLAAAIATIKEIEEKNVIKKNWQKGLYLNTKTNYLIKKNGLDDIISIKGIPPWQVMFFNSYKNYTDLEIKSYLQQELLQSGILWYGQHNLSFSHTKKDLDTLIKAYANIFPRLKQLLINKQLHKELLGKPITNIFKVR